MKEKLLMALIGFVVILILGYTVVAMASSYNATAPVKVHVQTTMNQLNTNTDRSDVNSTRPMNVPPGLKKATTGR